MTGGMKVFVKLMINNCQLIGKRKPGGEEML